MVLINFHMAYRGTLYIDVLSAEDVPHNTSGGLCDTYMVINYSNKTKKTKIVKQSQSPMWNES